MWKSFFHLVQDLIGGDGLDLIKLYLAPVRTFWKGVPEGSQVSSVRLFPTYYCGLQFHIPYCTCRLFPSIIFLILIAVWLIRDVYPGSWFLPIPDPGSKNSNKREGWKKFDVIPTFLCSHKFHKLVHYLSFKVLKKKIGPIFKEL
jgi:hypothetical protein